jgi:hypothetical protein
MSSKAQYSKEGRVVTRAGGCRILTANIRVRSKDTTRGHEVALGRNFSQHFGFPFGIYHFTNAQYSFIIIRGMDVEPI